MVVDQEDAALPVDAPVRAEDQIVGRMMGVGGAQALQEYGTDIRDIIPIGVFQEQQIGA